MAILQSAEAGNATDAVAAAIAVLEVRNYLLYRCALMIKKENKQRMIL